MTVNETEYLTAREAAAHLGLSTRTLDRYRVTGEGPVFLRFGGGVRYLREDLDEWARTRRRRSTSDDGTGERPALPGAPAPDPDPGDSSASSAPGSRAGKLGRARRPRNGSDDPGKGETQ